MGDLRLSAGKTIEERDDQRVGEIPRIESRKAERVHRACEVLVRLDVGHTLEQGGRRACPGESPTKSLRDLVTNWKVPSTTALPLRACYSVGYAAVGSLSSGAFRTSVGILSIVAGLICSGCVATNQRASDAFIGNVHTIAVVAVEAPPIFVHPASEADRLALDAAGVKAPPSAAEPWALRLNFPVPPGFFVGAAIDIASYAQSSTPHQGDALVMSSDKPSQWMPTVNLAVRAAQQISASSDRRTFVLNGYAKLPDIDRSKQVPFEDWLAVVRRWFNSDEAMLEPAAISLSSDAILQVGVLNYEYLDERLSMQVMVKVIDKNSNRVVARAREHAAIKGGTVAVMMRDQGLKMRDLVDASGASLLSRCLQDLGLASR